MPTNTAEPLPHWDMTPIFPSLESNEFQTSFANLVQSIDRLAILFDEHGIRETDTTPLDGKGVGAFEQVTEALNRLIEDMRKVSTYVSSYVSTNSRDDAAQAKMSELQQHSVRLAQLGTRFTAWIGSLDVEQLIERSSTAQAHAFMLRKTKTEAEHLMSPSEEELVAQLRPSSTTAWSKLHSNFTSQLTVSIEQDGNVRQMPMSMVRNLAYDSDRALRKKAYEAELAAWKSAAVPLAAALNSLKANMNVLSSRRRWKSPLDAALFDNNIDRETLDAMMAAANESFPTFRRYLRAKARALKVPALAWFDLFAPLGEANRMWSYEEGALFIRDKFKAFSPKMGNLADRAFHERWIDAEPRDGKRDGAFCMSIHRDESRILANFKPSFSSVGTLAHELGHAYHNVNLASRTALQRQTPMTLAETASIFCQRLVLQAGLKDVEPQDQIAILEESLQDACQVIVDITSRFLFEQNVFEKRKNRELSIEELNSLMLQAQRDTYGDGLDPQLLHPYMWAVKQHYYQTHFYNYPYMFGLLFGLGLFARYEQDPGGFKVGYDELLSSTGMGDAAELANRFGMEIRKLDFWRQSLAVIERDVVTFDQLVNNK